MRGILEQCRDLPELGVEAGQVLIEQGQTPGVLYVLEHGSAVVERDGIAIVRVDAPGAVLGELSVVLAKPATATVRASTALRLRVAHDPQAFLRARPGVALAVLRTVASRLEGLTAYLADIKRQFTEHSDHFGMIDEVLQVLIHDQPPDVAPGSARDPDPEY